MITTSHPEHVVLPKNGENSTSLPPKYGERNFFWLMLYGLPEDTMPNELGGWRPIKDKLRSLCKRPPGRVHIFDDTFPRQAMCIINEEVDAYVAYGAFAGCFMDGYLVTAALYKNDENSQLGCPQEPIEGPCDLWAKENSSKEQLAAKRNREKLGENLSKQIFDCASPPHYTSTSSCTRSSRRDSKPQYPRRISDAKRQGNFQACLPAMPGLNDVEPDQGTAVYTQDQAIRAYWFANTSVRSLPDPCTVGAPAYTTNSIPHNQLFNIPLSSSLQSIHELPILQHSQAQTPASSQPCSASYSGHTGAFPCGSGSVSGSPYLTSPSSAGSLSPYVHGVQLNPVDEYLPYPITYRPIIQGAGYIREKSGSCSSSGTPRNERDPSDGPIIIRS